jgi:hypothetical protein
MKRYEAIQTKNNSAKRDLLKPFAARAAIGLTLLSAGAIEATPAAAQPESSSSSAIVTGLKTLNHLKKGDKLRVLQGNTGGLTIDRGTVLHKFSAGKVVEAKPPVSPLHIYHAVYEEDGKNKRAFFKYESVSYELPLTDKRNHGHIIENYLQSHDPNDDNAIDPRPFNVKDISYDIVPVNNIEDGKAYTNKGAAHDFYTNVTVSNGDYRTMVRVAQAVPTIRY